MQRAWELGALVLHVSRRDGLGFGVLLSGGDDAKGHGDGELCMRTWGILSVDRHHHRRHCHLHIGLPFPSPPLFCPAIWGFLFNLVSLFLCCFVLQAGWAGIIPYNIHYIYRHGWVGGRMDGYTLPVDGMGTSGKAVWGKGKCFARGLIPFLSGWLSCGDCVVILQCIMLLGIVGIAHRLAR